MNHACCLLAIALTCSGCNQLSIRPISRVDYYNTRTYEDTYLHAGARAMWGPWYFDATTGVSYSDDPGGGFRPRGQNAWFLSTGITLNYEGDVTIDAYVDHTLYIEDESGAATFQISLEKLW